MSHSLTDNEVGIFRRFLRAVATPFGSCSRMEDFVDGRSMKATFRSLQAKGLINRPNNGEGFWLTDSGRQMANVLVPDFGKAVAKPDPCIQPMPAPVQFDGQAEDVTNGTHMAGGARHTLCGIRTDRKVCRHEPSKVTCPACRTKIQQAPAGTFGLPSAASPIDQAGDFLKTALASLQAIPKPKAEPAPGRRGRPPLGDARRERYCLTLSPTAGGILAAMAEAESVSTSAVIEALIMAAAGKDGQPC